MTQAIGRRYRRQDEIGTPFCVTFDFDSLDDDRSPCVTATRWPRIGSRCRRWWSTCRNDSIRSVQLSDTGLVGTTSTGALRSK